MNTRVAVFGLGNVLMGDDALGPTVVRTLQANWTFPEDVEVEDLGTPGLDLHPHLTGRDVVVLVDTVRSDGPPGTVRVYDKSALLQNPPRTRTSPHDPGVLETLMGLEFAGVGPREVVLVGVVPGEVGYELGLTTQVRDAVPEIERTVVRILEERGVPVERRPDGPRDPELWWEAPPAVPHREP